MLSSSQCIKLTKPVLKMDKTTRTAVIFISYSLKENVWNFIKYIACTAKTSCLSWQLLNKTEKEQTYKIFKQNL